MLFVILLTISSSAASSPLTRRDSDAFTDCFSSVGVRALTPNDPAYAQSAQPFNQRLEYLPSAIALPRNTSEVAAAVRCAAQYNVATVARSGGHSYTAFSLGGQDGSLVVDLAEFNDINVEGTSATIGAGSRLGDVALGLFAQGQRALPHGTCPYVGAGGHILGGGFGLDSRLWGLALDRVTGHEVVLANGSVVTTSATSHPDLFWALRGAGWSYGIVTSFTVETLPAPETNVILSYSWDLDASSANSTAAQVMLAFQSFSLDSAPAALGVEMNLGAGSARGRVAFQLAGAFQGTQAQAEAAIQLLLAQLPSPSNSTVSPLGWIDSLTNLGGSNTLNTTGVPGSRDTFYASSLMTPQSEPLTLEAYQAFVNYLGTAGFDTQLQWFTQTELYGGANSAIANVSTNATSFSNRDTLFTWQLYASSANYAPPYPESGIGFVQGMRSALLDAMPSNFTVRAYANYDDDQLSPAQWKSEYFAQDYGRLLEIKSAVDPNNLFRFPQSIGQGDLPNSSNATTTTTSNDVNAAASATPTVKSPAPSLFLPSHASLLVLLLLLSLCF